MSDYNLVSTAPLFSKIEAQLSQYTSNGLLDTNLFYAEIMLVINQLGIGAYQFTEAVVTLENNRAPLPCNFYLLDSAWLCDDRQNTSALRIPQSNFVMYTQTDVELITQKQDCFNELIRNNTTNGVIIQSTACNNNNENVLEKVTIREYVETGQEQNITWNRPILLTLNSKKSINQTVCVDKCKNLFSKSPYEISINQQGLNKYLNSNLKEPVIYLKYYAYPEDPETHLPLIPEDPIIQRAIEYQLMYYFFYNILWLNGNDVNIERKIQDLEVKRDKYMMEAKNYTKMPTFLKSVDMARRSRNKWNVYNSIYLTRR